MIKHYLKIAVRNLLKYKTQSLISMIGLSIGFTCFALSLLWIRYEMTYDDFHAGADRIYLAGNKAELRGDDFSHYSSDLLADYLKQHFPEIENVCHIYYSNDKSGYQYKNVAYPLAVVEADSSFISMFNIKVIEGDGRLRLNADQIAITEKAAKRIFGDRSPIGEELVSSDNPDIKKSIVAVVKAWEGHSQYTFDVLLPFVPSQSHWFSQQAFTLFRVRPHANVKALEQKLLNAEVDVMGHKREASFPIALLKTLRSTHPQENMNVKLNHVRLFACIGGLVILCGLCNYLTMFVTRIRMRKRELALRRINGASNRDLLALLLTELMILLLISMGIGALLIELVLPTFKRLSQIDENTLFFYKEAFLYVLALIVATTGVASVLVRCMSKRTLLDNINHSSALHLSGWFYKASILFQLIISIGFIFCTVVMMKQLDFLLHSKELGIERHNVGTIFTNRFKDVPFKDVLEKMPEVVQTLDKYNTPIPKSGYSHAVISEWEGKAAGDPDITIENEFIGPDFIEFFEIEVIEGSMPDENDKRETVLINEAAAKAFGWKNPVGKTFDGEKTNTVKGVIRDICYSTPIHPVAPAYYYFIEDEAFSFYRAANQFIFKYKEGTWKEVSRKLRKVAHEANPNSELSLSNMEEVYDEYMKSETTLSQLLSTASLVCIVIAVFGIFSLVTLSCEQRSKEIAIRKVNGASTGHILRLFLREYFSLYIASAVVAFPLGYLVMKYWLENYVKQTPIGVWIYAIIFIGMGWVILLSILWRIRKAARINPAEIIKRE